jgi:hypothetical protein
MPKPPTHPSESTASAFLFQWRIYFIRVIGLFGFDSFHRLPALFPCLRQMTKHGFDEDVIEIFYLSDHIK